MKFVTNFTAHNIRFAGSASGETVASHRGVIAGIRTPR